MAVDTSSSAMSYDYRITSGGTSDGRALMPELGICADAKEALEAILSEVRSRGSARSVDPWAKKVPELRAQLARKVDYDDVPIKAPRVFKELNEFFDEDTIFVTCIGLNQIWSGQLQQISKPRHYIDCGGAGPLGWDLPAAIGVKVARPEKQVVQVVGDFGFQFLYGRTFCGCDVRGAFCDRSPQQRLSRAYQARRFTSSRTGKLTSSPFHADYEPTLGLRFIVQRLSEGTNIGRRQAFGRTIGVLSFGVVVEHQHHQPRAVARSSILQHLLIAGRVTERSVRPTANHEVNALGLACKVVIQQEFGLFG